MGRQTGRQTDREIFLVIFRSSKRGINYFSVSQHCLHPDVSLPKLSFHLFYTTTRRSSSAKQKV